MLKKLLLFFLCGFLAVSAALADPVFQDLEGKQLQLSQLQGKWLVVNFWAAWCDICVQEIPELNQFVADHPNILFYGVNYDHLPIDALKAAVSKVNIRFPVLTEDPSLPWKLDQIEVLPTTFIFNPQGELVKVLVGPNTEESLTATLKSVGANVS